MDTNEPNRAAPKSLSTAAIITLLMVFCVSFTAIFLDTLILARIVAMRCTNG